MNPKPRVNKKRVSKNFSWLKVATIGSLMSFVGLAFTYSFSTPFLYTNDEALNTDYAWQASSGHLPDFYKGPNMPSISHSLPPVQRSAQHPPAYFFITGVAIKSSLESGHWRKAAAIGRLMNIFITCLGLLAIAWTTSLITKRKDIIAGVTIIASTSFIPIHIASNIGNDALSLLFVTLSLGVCILMLQRGFKWEYYFGLIALSIAGFSTRASFISIIILILGTIVVSSLPSLSVKNLGLALLRSTGLMIAVLGAIGWFYVRNYRLSGSWVGEHVEYATGHLHRTTKPLQAVITGKDLWLRVPSQMFADRAKNISVAVFIFSSFVTLGYFIKTKLWNLKNRNNLVLLLLLSQVLLIVAEQAVHKSHAGSYSIRYFAPSLLPITLMLAFTLTYFRQLRGLPVMLLSLVSIFSLISSQSGFISSLLKTNGSWHFILADAFKRSGIPSFLLPITLVIIGIGFLLCVTSMWKLTRIKQATEHQEAVRI